jgi:hypothetical protein
MYLAPRVYKTPHLLCQWSKLLRNKTTNFCISTVHTNPTFAVAVKLASTHGLFNIPMDNQAELKLWDNWGGKRLKKISRED